VNECRHVPPYTALTSDLEPRDFVHLPVKSPGLEVPMGMLPHPDDDLHFRTGVWGCLARFFVQRRAAGDPYDETLVLPSLIVLIVMQLSRTGRVGDWAVVAAMVVTGTIAAAWLTASIDAKFRVVLRGISVGAIQAAASALVYGSTSPITGKEIFDIIFVNYAIFFFVSIWISLIRDISLTTEKQWREGHKLIRIALKLDDLKGQSISVGVRVWIIRVIAPFLILALMTKIGQLLGFY
jgi:hypothetical protein